MKALLAFLITFSVFANDHFLAEKENTLKRLHADTNVPATVIPCVESAKTSKEMAACEGTYKKAHMENKRVKTKEI